MQKLFISLNRYVKYLVLLGDVMDKRKKLEEAIYEDERSTEEVSAILNRTGSTGAGGWTAKIQNYAYYNIDGHWEEMEQVKLLYSTC
jgi:hypothetical protein